MSDMLITQAAGSRNYSLHWRDGHGTWAGNHSVSRHDRCHLGLHSSQDAGNNRADRAGYLRTRLCWATWPGITPRCRQDARLLLASGLHSSKSASNDRADRNRTRRTSIGASTSQARSPRQTTRAGRRKGRARTAPGSHSARHAAHPRELGPTVAASPTPPARALLRSTPAPMLF